MGVDDLTSRHCKPCAKGDIPLNHGQAEGLLAELHADWRLDEPGREISRTFRFKDYYRTMAFVNALAWVAHEQDHHPDIEVGYNRCHVRYSTHAIGGLSENDFICAARLDALLPAPE
jgi:4a-hydroxytetrahydrobiopterin dehydratase